MPEEPLYIAGPKAQICELTNHLKDSNLFEDVRKIERIRVFAPHERIMGDSASLTDAEYLNWCCILIGMMIPS